MEITFLVQPVKGTNINKNGFSPTNEPYTAKLTFKVFRSIFAEID